MKRYLPLLLMACAPIAKAQGCSPGGGVTCTSNLNLYILPLHYADWNTPTNVNWTTVDAASVNWARLNAVSQTFTGTITAAGFVGPLTGDVAGNASGLSAPIDQSLVTGLTSSLAGKVDTTTTVNGHPLSSNVVVSASDITIGTLPHSQLPTLISADIPANAANTSGTSGGLTGTPAITVANLTLVGATTGCATWTGSVLGSTGVACGSGGGGVTTISTGSLSPLFTAAIANPTTTPALSFTLLTAAATTILGNATGGSATPSYTSAPVVVSMKATTFITNAEFSAGTCTTAKTIDPVNGNKQKMTLTNADTCALTLTQPASGTATVQLKITQSAAGSFDGGISGCKWPGGVVPTITQTSGAVDMVSIYLDGATAYCQIAQAFN